MTPEQFQHVKALYLELEPLPPAEARARLDGDATLDSVVRDEVRSMLTAAAEATTDQLLSRVLRHADRVLLAGGDGSADFVGREVGRYQITGVIGRGGMGVVYLGRDTQLGRSAALKAVVADAHDTLFLAMEHIEGKNLSQRLGKQALPVGEALRIAAQIAAGLEKAHDAGILHRDLKPANVVLTADGTAKVLDFGLAREIGAPKDVAGDTTQMTLTREGTFFGTPAYMSPEQIRCEPLDQRTDIFSFGVLLFRCLSGRMPFDGDTSEDIVELILSQEPAFERLPAATPATLRAVLTRFLAKSAADRYRQCGVHVRAAGERVDADRRAPFRYALADDAAAIRSGTAATGTVIGRPRDRVRLKDADAGAGRVAAVARGRAVAVRRRHGWRAPAGGVAGRHVGRHFP